MNSNKKYKILFAWIVAGLLLSFLLLVSLIPKAPEWIIVLCTILSTLGGGVFASAFIAFLIEEGHDRRHAEEIKEQKKAIFNDLQYQLPLLLSHETGHLSYYLSLCKNEQVKISKQQEKTIEEIIKLCYYYLDEIAKSEKESQERFSSGELMTIDYLSRCEEKEKVFQNSMSDYRWLQSSLIIIKDNSALYMLNKCLSSQEKDGIDNLYSVIDSILCHIEKDKQDDIIAHKLIFFEKLKDFCDLISLDTNQLQKVSFWEK